MPSQKFLESYVQINITDFVVELMFGLSGLLSVVKRVSPKNSPIHLNTCWFSSYTLREDVFNSYQLLFTIWPTINCSNSVLFWVYVLMIFPNFECTKASYTKTQCSYKVMFRHFFLHIRSSTFQESRKERGKIESLFQKHPQIK